MKVGEHWFGRAADYARLSDCHRDHCGAVLVKDGRMVGAGFNGPPAGALRSCLTTEPSLLKPKTDRTCCVHAEWRAILEAGREAKGATMFFTRTNSQGASIQSGVPYCTVCSRLALEAGVRAWVLRHVSGVREYSALAYHEVSQRFDVVCKYMEGKAVYETWAGLPHPLWLQEDLATPSVPVAGGQP